MTGDEVRIRLAEAAGLLLTPNRFFVCAHCSGVRFTRTLTGAWQAGAMVADAAGRPTFTAAAGGGPWADASGNGIACDTVGCPRFNQDTDTIGLHVIAGPGIRRDGTRVLIDGAIRAIEAWTFRDQRVGVVLTGGIVAELHACSEPVAGEDQPTIDGLL